MEFFSYLILSYEKDEDDDNDGIPDELDDDDDGDGVLGRKIIIILVFIIKSIC